VTTTAEEVATPPSILVVEDNYLTATQVCEIVRNCGYAVAGSVARVKKGLEFLSERTVDGALVDINLDGTYSFPLCAELERRKVPYSFLTGYQHSVIPAAFSGVPLLAKPADPAAIRAALAAMLPQPEVKSAPPAAALGNVLLHGLAPDDRTVLQPLLERMALHAGDVLEGPDVPATRLVFPTSGLVSMEAGTGQSRLQVAMIGREGMAGSSLLLGGGAEGHTVSVQYDGVAWSAAASALRPLLAENHRLREQLLRGVGDLMGQISANALAAARGTIEQRVARWLLMVSERLDSSEIVLTHETVARMLGVRRAGVTVALNELEGKGALRSTRCRVRIVDRPWLSALSRVGKSPGWRVPQYRTWRAVGGAAAVS